MSPRSHLLGCDVPLALFSSVAERQNARPSCLPTAGQFQFKFRPLASSKFIFSQPPSWKRSRPWERGCTFLCLITCSIVFFKNTYLSTPGVPKSGDISKSSRCKNAFYDNVRILSENHPKAFRMFPICFTTMFECSPRILQRLSGFSRHLSVEQYQRF